MYYLPETIPAEFRKPYDKKGIVKGESDLVTEGGISSNLYNASFEGGEKNGVLTAIEDFVYEHRNNYMFFRFDEEHGLGVLVRKKNLLTRFMFMKNLLKCQLSVWRSATLIKLDRGKYYISHPQEVPAMIRRKLNRLTK